MRQADATGFEQGDSVIMQAAGLLDGHPEGGRRIGRGAGCSFHWHGSSVQFVGSDVGGTGAGEGSGMYPAGYKTKRPAVDGRPFCPRIWFALCAAHP
jgi:hypothetical protein